ncbi:CTD-like phosphatase, putative [Babesia ovata]|uniref:protein-serine/threonine phosphatase n=1 Tax=Babesia ovata TaxID=189622 RepID=A0A2H6KG99_9APIC|nr:CTD-like phosphatase, putative [Babesia ovata]GBE62016.1 CTD-like phosphatase, putative [Babesia ovata]
MCPPFGMMPPIMPKQGVGMPRGAPVMFPFMDPAMYQNMMKSMAAKAAGKPGEELDMKALMATLPPAGKMPFPLPKNMPVMAMPPPGMMFPGPFMGMPKKAGFPGVMPFVPDPAFSPKASGSTPVRSQQTDSTPGHTQADSDRRHHSSAAFKYLNLSQISRGGRTKRSRASVEEGSENISVISDEDYRNGDDGPKDALDGDSSEGNTPANIAFVNSFVPSPPERYRRDYQLHEVKMFSALGIRAQAKAKNLSPEVRASFESGPVKNGKLVLLLDLDNTLLHACSQSKMDMLDIQLSHFVDELGEPELYKFTMPNFANVRYYMKLRPALRGFLQVLSLYYEMSIYTNATKEYADVVVSILDPDRSLFMDRIVARTSVGERDLQKTAARLYPGLDTRFVVAFDDRTDVWADVPYNQVVKAEHYDFFDSHIAELSDSYGIVSTNAESTYYTDSDRHLEYMVKVFLELHRRFFNDPFEASVGHILEDMQRSVLEGVGIMLTGYRKNSKGQGQVLQADCEQKQREIATQLGAKVCTKLSDKKLTHVVAGKNCTDNIIKSKDPCYSHVHKVHTLWLYSCRATWTNVPPDNFNVDEICDAYSNEPPSQPCKDHWKLIQSETTTSAKRPVADTAPEDQLPTRIFMGTGSYSHGTELISPTERVVIRWDPAKTKLLQNNATDPIEQKNIKQIVLENAPYTNSVNPERYA